MYIPTTILNTQVTGIDGWVANTSVLTRTGNFTFTEVGDTTAKWSKGTRFEYTQGGVVEWGVVSSSAFGAVTTVTLATNITYAMAAGTLDNPRYSYAANPQGWPGWFAYTPTYGGFSAAPTPDVRFNCVGNICHIMHQFANHGTSNATNFTISLPIDVVVGAYFPVKFRNGGADSATAGEGEFSSGTTLGMFTTFAAGAWSNSLTKNVGFEVFYQF